MKRFRLAVVGLNFGRHIVEQELLEGPGRPYFEVTTVVDLDTTKAATLAARHGLRVAPSFDAVLNDPSIDAIGLFTAPAGRAALVAQAVTARKPVMTTKPFELDPEAALTVLRAARQAGVVVHMNSPSPRPAADLQLILDWQTNCGLGALVAARYETYARYDEHADGSWYDDPARCPVAPIFRLGIYAINDLIRLVGEPVAVAVQHARLFTGRPTPDNAHLSLRYANGALGSVFCSFCVGNGRSYPNTLVLHFQHGTIWRDAQWAATEDFGKSQLRVIWRQGEEPRQKDASVPREQTSGNYDWAAFNRAVAGTPPGKDETTPEQIVAGLRVIDALRRNESTGGETQWASTAVRAGGDVRE